MYKNFLLNLIDDDIKLRLMSCNAESKLPKLMYISKENLPNDVPFSLFLVYSQQNGFDVYIVSYDIQNKKLLVPNQGNNGEVFVVFNAENFQSFVVKIEKPQRGKDEFIEYFNRLYEIQENVKNQGNAVYTYIDLIAGDFIEIDDIQTYVSIMPQGKTLPWLFSSAVAQNQIKHFIDQVLYLCMFDMYFFLKYTDEIFKNTLVVFDDQTNLWHLKICDLGINTLCIGDELIDIKNDMGHRFLEILTNFFAGNEFNNDLMNENVVNIIKNIRDHNYIANIMCICDDKKNNENTYYSILQFYEKQDLLPEKKQLADLFDTFLLIDHHLNPKDEYNNSYEIMQEIFNHVDEIMNIESNYPDQKIIQRITEKNNLLSVQFLLQIIECEKREKGFDGILENVRNCLISSATFADFHNHAMEIVSVLNDFNSEISKTITLQQDVSVKQQYDNFEIKIEKDRENIREILNDNMNVSRCGCRI